MPWTCACPTELNDDVPACAACGMDKAAWTLTLDHTRVLQVTRALARLEARRGVRGGQPGETEPTTVCPVSSKSSLLSLVHRGAEPAPEQRLVARVWPGKRPRQVTLTVDLAQEEPLVVEVDASSSELSSAGAFDVTFLCVYGPEDVSSVALPGVQLVDVSDAETDDGYADGVELDAVRKTIELPTAPAGSPRVRLLEVEDLCFATGREVLFAGGWSRADDTTGLSVVAAALERARRYPSQRLLVAGHTDTRGSVASNQVLSADRATNVHLYLTGQREAWAAHCQTHFEVADVQSILKWVDFMFAWDCDPGPVDGDWGPGSAAARDTFRRQYNQEHAGALVEGAPQSEADWCALFDLYDVELAEKLRTQPAQLAALRSGLTFLEPPTLACSEHWATERPGAPSNDAANRRVDVLFFDANEAPELPGSPPGAPIYAEGSFEREYLTVEDAFRELEPPYGDAPFEEVCKYVQRHSASAQV